MIPWLDITFYKAMLDSLFDAVYFVDKDRQIRYWNHAAELITGYSAEEVVGSHCQDNILCHIDENGNPLCCTGCPLMACMKADQRIQKDVFLRHKNGRRLGVTVRVAPLSDWQGDTVGAVEIFILNGKLWDHP